MSHHGTNLRIILALALGLIAGALGLSMPSAAGETGPATDRQEVSETSDLRGSEPRGIAQTDRLLTLIVTWLSANFDLPAIYDHPKVELVPADRIAALRFGSSDVSGYRDVVAVYHDRRRTIYLSAEWSGKTPAELSVLVHEMVHHLQNMSKQTFLCPQEREKAAYDAQEKWLGMFGRSLSTEFEIDPLTLLVSARCM